MPFISNIFNKIKYKLIYSFILKFFQYNWNNNNIKLITIMINLEFPELVQTNA